MGILGGEFNSDHGWGFVITKHDETDNIVWQKNYGKGHGAILRSMLATEDGGYIMLGESFYTDADVLIHHGDWSDADLWVIRLDSNGNKVWSNVIGGTSNESAATLVSAPGDGCYVVGGAGSNDYDCTGNHGGGEAYVARLDKDGNILWHNDLGGSKMDVAISAFSNGSGGVIIAAQTYSGDGNVHNYHGGSDYWVVELDEHNNILWDNCYGTVGYQVPMAICKATDGSIWVNGFAPDDFSDNIYIVHLNSAGVLLSSKILGSTGQDCGQIIYPLNDGLVIAGGYYYRSDSSFSSITNYGYIDAFLTILAPWTTDISDETANNDWVSLQPNPAMNVVTVKSTNPSNEYSILIADITGRVVFSGTATGKELTIDVSSWSRGMYVATIQCKEGRYTRKLMISQ